MNPGERGIGSLEPAAQNRVRLEQLDRGARNFDISAHPPSDLVGGPCHGDRYGLLPGHGRGIEPEMVGHYHRQTDHHPKGDARSAGGVLGQPEVAPPP